MHTKNDDSSQSVAVSPFEFKNIWVTDINEKAAIEYCERIQSAFEEDPYRPIIVNISSYGGEVDALFVMLDFMDAIRDLAPPSFKFLTVATGKACSAGAVLLACGDVRFATKQSRVMLHQLISGSYGSQPANEAELKESSRVNNQLLNLLRKRCKWKMSMKQLKEKLAHNLYLSPRQAMDLGLVDIIGYPKLASQMIYEVRVVNAEPPKKAKKVEGGKNAD